MDEIKRTDFWVLQAMADNGEIPGLKKIQREGGDVIYKKNGETVLADIHGVCFATKELKKLLRK